VCSLPEPDEEGAAPFHIDRERCHLMLESVPAWVCEQCGEAYFEETEVDAIQDLIRAIDDRTEALALTA